MLLAIGNHQWKPPVVSASNNVGCDKCSSFFVCDHAGPNLVDGRLRSIRLRHAKSCLSDTNPLLKRGATYRFHFMSNRPTLHVKNDLVTVLAVRRRRKSEKIS